MNRTKEMIEIMQAYLDGKRIQWKDRTSADNWKDCDEEPSWHLDNDYRIKPEPKYRPLKPEELGELKGVWLINKNTKFTALVTAIHYERNWVRVMESWYESANLLANFTYEDGTPVGILEEV